MLNIYYLSADNGILSHQNCSQIESFRLKNHNRTPISSYKYMILKWSKIIYNCSKIQYLIKKFYIKFCQWIYLGFSLKKIHVISIHDLPWHLHLWCLELDTIWSVCLRNKHNLKKKSLKNILYIPVNQDKNEKQKIFIWIWIFKNLIIIKHLI